MEVVIDFIAKGGVMMFPLLIVAFVTFVFIAEKFLALKKEKRDIELISQAHEFFRNDNIFAIKELVKDKEGVVSHLLGKGIYYLNHESEILEDRLKQVIYEEVSFLEKRMSSIQTFASILPMLGLLGTVTGMIAVFKTIAVAGVGDAQALSGGISEALITTQTGLCTAIPAVYGYSLLNDMIDQIINELKRASAILMNASRMGKGN